MKINYVLKDYTYNRILYDCKDLLKNEKLSKIKEIQYLINSIMCMIPFDERSSMTEKLATDIHDELDKLGLYDKFK